MRSLSAIRRPAIALIALSAVVGGFSLVLAQPEHQPGGGQPTPPPPGSPAQPTQPGQPGQPGEGRAPGRSAPGAGGEFRSLNSAMKALNGAARTLKTNIEKPEKKTENLLTIESMQKAVLAAKGMDPGDLKGEDKDKEKVVLGFRKAQIKLLSALLELESAVLDGKTDVAKGIVDKLGEMKDAGHSEFKADKPRGPGGRGGGGRGE